MGKYLVTFGVCRLYDYCVQIVMERPDLNNKISVSDFKDFYWLKNELIDLVNRTE